MSATNNDGDAGPAQRKNQESPCTVSTTSALERGAVNNFKCDWTFHCQRLAQLPDIGRHILNSVHSSLTCFVWMRERIRRAGSISDRFSDVPAPRRSVLQNNQTKGSHVSSLHKLPLDGSTYLNSSTAVTDKVPGRRSDEYLVARLQEPDVIHNLKFWMITAVQYGRQPTSKSLVRMV